MLTIGRLKFGLTISKSTTRTVVIIIIEKILITAKPVVHGLGPGLFQRPKVTRATLPVSS
jgi:hypothetical protein